MDSSTDNKSFFSVQIDLILEDNYLPYDLYVNSSANTLKERFVKIFPRGDLFHKEFKEEYRHKYHTLYVSEEQRKDYLLSLVHVANVSDEQKTSIIKDSAIHYLGKLFDNDHEFTTEVLEDAIEGCKESVEAMIDVIKDFNINKLQELIANLSFHDFYTFDHSVNVSMYCMSILKTIKPDASRQYLMLAGLGGMLHDLGKVNIPTHIINNPGKLSDEEFLAIKSHPGMGKDLLDETHCCDGHVDFNVVGRIILEHHENFNGSGYPKKLQGKDIHLFARIAAIADFFDAITTKRSYHKPLSSDEALDVMSQAVGKKLDPELFNLFASKVQRIVKARVPLMELPEDFDPCQPHNELPFKRIEPKYLKQDIIGEKDADFGKIKVEGPLFSSKKNK